MFETNLGDDYKSKHNKSNLFIHEKRGKFHIISIGQPFLNTQWQIFLSFRYRENQNRCTKIDSVVSEVKVSDTEENTFPLLD